MQIEGLQDKAYISCEDCVNFFYEDDMGYCSKMEVFINSYETSALHTCEEFIPMEDITDG